MEEHQLIHTAAAAATAKTHFTNKCCCRGFIVNPHISSFHLKTFPCYSKATKSDQLAATNCALAHLFAAIHPSIILTLPAVS